MRGGMELNVGTVVPADVLIMTIGLRDHHNLPGGNPGHLGHSNSSLATR